MLLIGGGSGTGKTTLARAIGREVGAAWAQVDDYRLALQRATTPAQQPELHHFLTGDVWSGPPQVLRDRLIAVGRVVSDALEIVVANHVATDAPLVLEGDGIVPAMAAQRSFAGLDVDHHVRAVFVVEPEETSLLDAMLARGRGVDRLGDREQRTQARASWLYGQWLQAGAEAHGLPVVETRPWGSLVDRVMSAAGSPR